MGGASCICTSSSDKLTWKTGLDYQVTPDQFALWQHLHRL